MVYAGIGSRETPKDILTIIEKLAEKLVSSDWILRTGGAPGADYAFLKGAFIGSDSPHPVELYLPWDGFEDFRKEDFAEGIYCQSDPSPAAFEIAKKYHPAWYKLSQGARRLIARNSHQVLGPDLASPVDCVICWTEDGKLKGGTAQALRIAQDRNIPIYNLGDPLTLKLFSAILI